MALISPALIEATLFAAGEPMTKKRLASLLDISHKELTAAIEVLHGALKGHGLALVETDEELELRTAPEAAHVIKKLRESELSRELGKASLETLSIVLYRGTATRGDIDWVRGVNSGAALRSLLLRGLIERSEDAADKRRALYKPTVDALAHLGVSKREELPRYSEFTASLDEQAEKAALASDDV